MGVSRRFPQQSPENLAFATQICYNIVKERTLNSIIHEQIVLSFVHETENE